MRILWLNNIVLPDFCEEFNIRRTVFGGWITGMLSKIEKYKNIDIGLCFPIFDECRMKNGEHGGHKFYSFHFEPVKVTEKQIQEFIDILNDYRPDVIHIWGTEFPHSLAMVKACEKVGLLDKVVVSIQGLISICAKYYTFGLPSNIKEFNEFKNVEENFKERGKLESEVIRKVHHVIGRTDWDKAYTNSINKNVKYHFCNEILRNEFYENIRKWNINNCERYSIFVSQADYPIKGLHFLLRAMPYILSEFPNTHIYVGGRNIIDVDKRDMYANYISELINIYNLEKHITFLGMLNEKDMCRQYLKSNVFVSASTIENSSNSVGEALMLGVPVVASYVGGISNLIKHEENGYLYQCDSVEMLGFYVKKVFANKVHLNGGLSSVNFDREDSVKNNINIYKDIIGE